MPVMWGLQTFCFAALPGARGKSWVYLAALNIRGQVQLLEETMKKLVLAAALAGVASFAHAGSIDAPIIEPEVVIETVEETSTGTSGGILLPLIIIALIAAAA